MLTIRTQYTTTERGAGRILAKGGGKQRTLPYDHSVSPARNHGLAAGELALVLITGKKARQIAARGFSHIGRANSTHEFRL